MMTIKDYKKIRDWAAYIIFCFVVVLFQISTILETNWGSLYLPILLFLMALIWILHNPEIAHPAVILGGTFFLDFCLFYPPGLWSAIVLLACEILRSQSRFLVTSSFWEKAIWIMLIIGVAILVHHLLRGIFFLPRFAFLIEIKRLVILIILFPLIYGMVKMLFTPLKFDEGYI